VGGALAAAWPLIRDDLDLSYAEIGLALTVAGLIGSAVDPLFGLLADTGRRRAVLVGGGIAFALANALVALSVGLWTLVLALVVAWCASGAFVSLSQATLMDLDAEQHERRMAWWTLAGSFGYVGGPLLLAAAIWIGTGWRGAILGLALLALPLALAARRLPFPAPVDGTCLRAALRGIASELRRREVLRWLALLEAGDLLLDVLHAFLALYFVDVAGSSAADAALAVAVWTGAGLVGDALLIPVLSRVRGATYLRVSAVATAVCYPVFLLVEGTEPKLVLLAALGLLNAGWYAISKAGLYSALPGRSGAAVAVGGIAGLVGSLIPLGMGVLASAVGLGTAMWALLAAPVLFLVLLPRR
jgi:FSR family fosmidomycin resistance protein-like MFS transporter